MVSEERLIEEITDELTVEFQTQPTFRKEVLHLKVKDAVRKVKARKCYENTTKTDEQIADDLYIRHYQDIKDVATYNFAKIGGYFESSHSENSTSRVWISEDEVLGNITAFVKIF